MHARLPSSLSRGLVPFLLLFRFVQVLAITNAKRVGAKEFVFPGDSQVIGLKRDVAYFITMNPGYQGRQELPENLKVCIDRFRTWLVSQRPVDCFAESNDSFDRSDQNYFFTPCCRLDRQLSVVVDACYMLFDAWMIFTTRSCRDGMTLCELACALT